MEYRFEGHAHCFHMLPRTFFKQKILDTKHGPSIIWSGRVVNEWHQMCHNGVTLIIFLGACAERSYFSAADASKYKMRLRGTTPW